MATPTQLAERLRTATRNFVDWSVEHVDRTDPTALGRARLLVVGYLCAVAIATVWAPIQAVITTPLNAVMFAVSPFLGALVIVVLRKTGSVSRAGHVLFALVLMGTIAAAAIRGGNGAIAFIGASLIPVMAALILGWRGAVFWATMLVLAIVTFECLDRAGLTRPLVVDLETFSQGSFIVAIAVTVGLCLLGGMMAHINRRALDSAVEARRLKGEFVAAVSHDLRTPMNGILGMAQLLADTDLDQDQRSYVGDLQRAGQLLLELVSDVLDYSKLNAGEMTVSPAPFDLHTMVEDVVDIVRSTAAERNLALIVRIAPDTPRLVVGDRRRIAQVLTNLAANAVKFTRRGHVMLDISGSGREGDLAELVFAVHDTGPGIPATRLARIFDQYAQVGDGDMSQLAGWGLGLSITQALVQRMGGKLDVESEVGVGSTFKVSLLLPCLAPIGEASRPLKRVSVVLVDRHPTRSQVIVERLKQLGATVVPLESCDQLQHLSAATSLVDILVVDGSVPSGGHGPAPFADVRWTLLTAKPTRPTGAWDHVIQLPFKEADLVKALRRRNERSQSTTMNLPAVPPPRGDGREVRILLAEDDPISLRVASRLLERLGAKVDTVVDGQEAVERFAEGSYDLVFLDAQMPRLDGFETCREMRQMQHGMKVPIVALTAGESVSRRAAAQEAGMDDYLTKPVDLDTLTACLERWVWGPRATHSPSPLVPGPAHGPVTSTNRMARPEKQVRIELLKR
ncbi:MAG: signal transduction histidine kinase/CheY-like chemotaxis protein [Myxococcota bacterium]